VTPGKRIRGATYLHRSALGTLDDANQARVRLATRTTGAAWNVVRVARGEVSLLHYGDFEVDPFPALRASTIVHDDGRVVNRDYSQRFNPPILHRKELLVRDDHPHRSAWSSATARLVQAGAFVDPHRIGTREAWRRRLRELAIDETGETIA